MLIPQPIVYEHFTFTHLASIFWAIVINLALLAKELLKVLTLKVIDSLTAQVF